MPRRTESPLTISRPRSTSDASTMMKSKTFQPLRKKPKPSAPSFSTHSIVNTDVNTCVRVWFRSSDDLFFFFFWTRSRLLSRFFIERFDRLEATQLLAVTAPKLIRSQPLFLWIALGSILNAFCQQLCQRIELHSPHQRGFRLVFYCVLLSVTLCYWVFVGSTGFHTVVLGFTGFE